MFEIRSGRKPKLLVSPLSDVYEDGLIRLMYLHVGLAKLCAYHSMARECKQPTRPSRLNTSVADLEQGLASLQCITGAQRIFIFVISPLL
jgi:hypothetical protein